METIWSPVTDSKVAHLWYRYQGGLWVTACRFPVAGSEPKRQATSAQHCERCVKSPMGIRLLSEEQARARQAEKAEQRAARRA